VASLQEEGERVVVVGDGGSVYNILASPIAAGILYPRFGIMLRPEWSARLMRVASIIVAVNAVLPKGVERNLA